MDTIYSKIIWQELGLKDYKISKEPWEKTDALILNWFKESSLEKINEVLSDISWISDMTNEGWYDGQFYGINQTDKEKRPINEYSKAPQADLVIHDAGLMPSMLQIGMKAFMSPSDFRLIANILEIYYAKEPKSKWSMDMKNGEEF